MDIIDIPVGNPLISFNDELEIWENLLKVGGTNLLQYTGFDNGNPKTQFESYNSYLEYLKDTNSLSGYAIKSIKNIEDSNLTAFGFSQSILKNKLVPYGIYTISFLIKSTFSNEVDHSIRININDERTLHEQTITNSYTQVIKTFTLHNITEDLIIQIDSINTDSFTICNLKLEEGNVCTSWSKSPLDLPLSSGDNIYTLDSITSFNVTPGNGYVKLSWRDPDNLIINGEQKEWKNTVIVYNTNNIPKDIYDGEIAVESNVRDQYLLNPFKLENLENNTKYYFKAFSCTTDDVYNNLNLNNIKECTPTENPELYGINFTINFIEKDVVMDESTMTINYTDTNANYNAASIVNKNEKCIINYNEWSEFLDKIIGGICLVKDGKVNYYLDPNDITKKITGEDADITSGKDGDVMVEFNKFAYQLDSDSGRIITVKFTDHDSAFESSADYNKFFKTNTKMYVSVFEACLLDGKLRSLNYKQPAYIKPVEVKNYIGRYNIISYDQFMYIYLLRFIILKYRGWSIDGYKRYDKPLKTGESIFNAINGYGEVNLFNLENFATNTQKMILDCNFQSSSDEYVDYTSTLYTERNRGFGTMALSGSSKLDFNIKFKQSKKLTSISIISFGFNCEGSPVNDPKDSTILYNVDDRDDLTKDIGYRLVYMI